MPNIIPYPTPDLQTSLNTSCINHTVVKYDDMKLAIRMEMKKHREANLCAKCIDGVVFTAIFVLIILMYNRCMTIDSKIDTIMNNMNYINMTLI